jgi:hypothetical protein
MRRKYDDGNGQSHVMGLLVVRLRRVLIGLTMLLLNLFHDGKRVPGLHYCGVRIL